MSKEAKADFKPMNYRNLVVWNKAMILTECIYRGVHQLPREELFGLSDQMRRAAVSIPSNIAEGSGRLTPNDFCHFLSVARGSTAELETQLMICQHLHYLPYEYVDQLLGLCDEIRRMLSVLIDRYRE